MEHELNHVRKAMYPCMDPSCHYPPFPTAQAMKAHAKAHHEVPAPRKTIRRPIPSTSTSLPRPSTPIKDLFRDASSVSRKNSDNTLSPLDPVSSTATPPRPSNPEWDLSWLKRPDPWHETFDYDFDEEPTLLAHMSPASADLMTLEPLPPLLGFQPDDDLASPPPADPKRVDELASGKRRGKTANGLSYDEPSYRLPEPLFQRGEYNPFSSSMASHIDGLESDEIEKPWEHVPMIIDVSQNLGAEQPRWTEQSSQSFKASETNPLHPSGMDIDSEPSQISSNHHYPPSGSMDGWSVPPEEPASFHDPSGKMASSSWRDAEISAPQEIVEQPDLPVQDYQMQLMLLEQQEKKRATILAQKSDTAGPGSIQQSDTPPNHLIHHSQPQNPQPGLNKSDAYVEFWEITSKILLLSNDKNLSSRVSMYLSSTNCRVVCAEVDEEIIVDTLRINGRLNLIFLDIDSHSHPLSQTIQEIDLIRALQPHVAIVAVVSRMFNEYGHSLYQQGVTDMLDKPFTSASLNRVVEKHCPHSLKY